MRAVGVNEYGGPDALEVVELPDPEPGPGQLLVRVHAAAVNPTDTYAATGARAEQQSRYERPYVPGMDIAGILEAIGEEVDTDLQVGDRVMAIVLPAGRHGAYSEKLALPAASVVAAPAGSSHAEAATLPMNGLTARLALDLLDLQAGDTLAVTGAAGALGGLTIQLAKDEGLRVIADAKGADEQLVADLGADVVVPRGDQVADRIREHAPGGVDGLLDGSVQNQLLFDAVRDGGGFATVRGFQADAPRDITLHQVWVWDYAENHAALDRLRQQAEEGVLSMRVADVYPPEQAPQTHHRLAAGGVRGRLIIEF